jgi:hypothetical protein
MMTTVLYGLAPHGPATEGNDTQTPRRRTSTKHQVSVGPAWLGVSWWSLLTSDLEDDALLNLLSLTEMHALKTFFEKRLNYCHGLTRELGAAKTTLTDQKQ